MSEQKNISYKPTTIECPKCGSQNVYCPGPFVYNPLFDQHRGWLLCYGCGERTMIDYREEES